VSADPRTQDMWFMGIMGLTWHKYPAGSPQSVCGMPWSLAANAWDSRTEQPTEDLCNCCHHSSAGEKS
jgi:hypothetical protein